MIHRSTLSVLTAGLALVPLAANISQAAKPTRKQKLHALRARLHNVRLEHRLVIHRIITTKRAQVRVVDRLNRSYQDLEDANAALQVSKDRLHQAEGAVQDATTRLRIARERLLGQEHAFGHRIDYYYKEGPVSYAEVLLGARDVSDFLDRQYYVSRIMDQDASLLTTLKAAQQEVARQRQQFVARRAELAVAHRENATRVDIVAERAADLERLKRELRQKRALEEQRLEELEQDSSEIQRSLEKELARRVAHPHAYRALPAWTGSFSMPARGPVTSGFGYRYHPILHYRRLHTGLDIGSDFGAPVYAAASGEVFFASWRGGYGRCIIVLHGGGVSTLYGHLSRILVRQGQSVRRGQPIGAVGSTGLSTGPHLHFEVRRNGVPVNPR